jgi:hypothetical protein
MTTTALQDSDRLLGAQEVSHRIDAADAATIGPTPEEIAAAAYARYAARGYVDGHDLEDWLEAESELFERRAVRVD